jgi:hypothetical protein
MRPERDLNRLLASLDPQLQPDEWIFRPLAPDEDPSRFNPALVFREREGITVLSCAQRQRGLGWTPATHAVGSRSEPTPTSTRLVFWRR